MRIKKKLFRYSKNKTYLILIFFISIFLGIGFAYLNSSLNISGTTAINKNTWDVHFENIQIAQGSKSDATVDIVNNSTTVNFDINLEEQGQYLDFTVDIVNNGTIDAMLSEVVNAGISEASKQYLDYSLTYDDGIEIKPKDLLEAGASETIHVYAKYKDNIDPSQLPEDDVVQEVSLSMSYIQADDTARYRDIIPEGYSRVEYLESTGTQYIDTGISGLNAYMFEYEFQVMDITNQQYASHLSAVLDNFTIGSYRNIERLYLRWRGQELSSDILLRVTCKNKISVIDNKLMLNGIKILDVSTSQSLGSKSANIYIFNNSSLSRYTKDKFYSLKLYDEDKKLLRDFIPCIDNNDRPCLYDAVSKQTFYNQGTGEFTVGNTIQPDRKPSPSVNPPVCKRAKTLHSDINGAYGNLGSGNKLNPGDAFDCDVNKDGVYDDATERFYYVSDLDSNSSYAVLIYSNGVTNTLVDDTYILEINNKTPKGYDSNNRPRQNGPAVAVLELPTTEQWKNVRLYSETRPIKDPQETTTYLNFTYENRAARLLTYKEAVSACGSGTPTDNGYLNNCKYLMENTAYTNPNVYKNNYWLENADGTQTASTVAGNQQRLVSGYSAQVSHSNVRPAIEVQKTKMSLE